MPKNDGGAGIPTLVLAVLKSGEMYGYQIILELEQRSQGVFRMKEGTLYPVLHGLEREKLVSAREDTSEAGRRRRYYALTRAGEQTLRDRERSWEEYSRAVTAILRGGELT